MCDCNKTCGCSEVAGGKKISEFLLPAISFVMLLAGMIARHLDFMPFTDSAYLEIGWFILAFLPVGLPVMKEAWELMEHGDFFNEFTLMTVACIGAFCIGEYPEAVGVMLFYSIGESFQDRAVDKARRNIESLLDVRSEKARVVTDGETETMDPKEVSIGVVIEVRPGERVPLDGVLLDDNGVFDTSALTGESIPRTVEKGDDVLAGMISTSYTIRMKVTRLYGESALSRILRMVEDASERKARPELAVRKFARVYTPIVMVLAVLLVLVPWVVSLADTSFHYIFSEWLYRSLVFLVISCPCALVISVPLSYFAGIGAASKAGILFKGGNYIDAITRINVVAFDKTGTLTTGRFRVERVESASMANEELLSLMAAAEQNSTHPLARALTEYVGFLGISIPSAKNMKEIAGFGTEAEVNGKKVTAGNTALLKKEGVDYPSDIENVPGTVIASAVDGKYAGMAVLADTLKAEASDAVKELGRLGIKDVVMLSGDREEIAASYAATLGISESHGALLPEDKAAYVEKTRKIPGKNIAFVGDGLNDAPVLALSDVGIAMGGLGSDAAIESADVVIQTDNPIRVATAIKIGRVTRAIVRENIVGAIAIKGVILGLGAAGIASLWAAVFADVGVALLAVLNSMRILWKRY